MFINKSTRNFSGNRMTVDSTMKENLDNINLRIVTYAAKI